jgi:hypothetical protein
MLSIIFLGLIWVLFSRVAYTHMRCSYGGPRHKLELSNTHSIFLTSVVYECIECHTIKKVSTSPC